MLAAIVARAALEHPTRLNPQNASFCRPAGSCITCRALILPPRGVGYLSSCVKIAVPRAQTSPPPPSGCRSARSDIARHRHFVPRREMREPARSCAHANRRMSKPSGRQNAGGRGDIGGFEATVFMKRADTRPRAVCELAIPMKVGASAAQRRSQDRRALRGRGRFLRLVCRAPNWAASCPPARITYL